MVEISFEKYLNTNELNEAVAEEMIDRIENIKNIRLPEDYKEFLRLSNGYEGELGKEGYLVLWSVEDLIELNDAYEVDEFVPGILLIGSDGSNSAYGIDLRNHSYISVPFIGMELNEVKQISTSISTFILRLVEA